MNVEASIEAVHSSRLSFRRAVDRLFFTALIHSAVEQLPGDFELDPVHPQATVSEACSRLQLLVDRYYSLSAHRGKLDSLIAKLPASLQEVVFTRHLPSTRFPAHCLLRRAEDNNYLLCDESVERLGVFGLLPDQHRGCLLSRVLVVVCQHIRDAPDQWHRFVRQALSDQSADRTLHRLVGATEALLGELRRDSMSLEATAAKIDEFFTIIEQVKKELHIRHPLQTTVLFTMNLFWDFSTDQSQPDRPLQLADRFEAELGKYHERVRHFSPDFMAVVAGREKPDLQQKFRDTLRDLRSQPQTDRCLDLFGLLEASRDSATRCLLSAQKLFAWASDKASSILSKSTAKRMPLLAFVGNEAADRDGSASSLKVAEELKTVVSILNEKSDALSKLKASHKRIRRIARNGRVDLEDLFVYDLCAPDGILLEAAAVFARLHNQLIADAFELLGERQTAENSSVSFKDFTEAAAININESQKDQLLCLDSIFDDQAAFRDGIKMLIFDSVVQARPILLDGDQKLLADFAFAAEAEDTRCSAWAFDSGRHAAHRHELSPITHMGDLLRLEWTLAELAASQDRGEKRWKHLRLRADSAGSLHLALAIKKLAQVFEANAQKLKSKVSSKPASTQLTEEVVRRVASIADIDLEENLWHKKLADELRSAQTDCTVADVLHFAHLLHNKDT